MISLKKAIEVIAKANPVMGRVLRCEKKLEDYCREEITTHKFHPIHQKRQEPYLQYIKNKTKKLFPKEDIKLNIEEGMIADTTDHHNILNYPTIIGAHFISRFDSILDRKNKGDYFVLDCGNVSFSEVLNKRGVNINGKHINLYPKKDKNKLISRYPLYKYDLLKSASNSGHQFSKQENRFLKKMDGIIKDTDFSNCERLSDQIVKINFNLWQEFFSHDSRKLARRCITLEHDEILIKYLSNYIINQDNIVARSLFDKKFRDLVLKEFSGIYGAWEYGEEKNSGTYFFWGFCSEDGKEYPLKLEGNILKNPQNKIRNIRLTPRDIKRGLDEGILIPSIFTKFATVGTYLGAKMMGGPGQTEYAGKLHRTWLNIIKKHDKKEYELAQKVPADNFNAFDLAFRKNEKGKIFREWGFDIAMNHRFSQKYLNNLKQAKTKYLAYPVIPISYYRLAPAGERQKIDYKESDLYQGFDWLEN